MMHNERANIAFVDGHVGSCSTGDLYESYKKMRGVSDPTIWFFTEDNSNIQIPSYIHNKHVMNLDADAVSRRRLLHRRQCSMSPFLRKGGKKGRAALFLSCESIC